MEESTNGQVNFQPAVPPQEDRPEEPKKVLRLGRSFVVAGDSIQKLAHNRWYVDSDSNLLDLADDLSVFASIPAVGVVDPGGKLVGLIIRRDLFDLLSRPFGRDVLKTETVIRVASTSPFLLNSASIFAIGEEIGKTGFQGEMRHFGIRTMDGEFAGIFSSQDLLIYLSEMNQKDMRLARAIQGRIVRDAVLVERPEFEVVASSMLSSAVGGDFYHITNYGDKWALAMCDVSGEGVAASLVTCALWGVVQSFDHNHGIKHLVNHLNKFFISTFEKDKSVKGVFFDFDPVAGTLLMCDQGHGYCHIIRGDKFLKMKTTAKSIPIGVNSEIQPEVFRYQLEKDDLLFIATDGFVEQKNQAGDTFGLARIKQVLDRYRQEDFKNLRKQLMADFTQFRGGSPQIDDASFMVLRWRSEP